MIEKFRTILGEQYVLIGDQLKDRYHHIWKMDVPLKAKALLLPKTKAQISEICTVCTSNNQPIIVFGGLTNLVGSTETKGDEVVISMERFNEIEEIDVLSRTMTVQAGVILENAQIAAKEKALLLPLNFGAKGSAQIGGIISTNAGGLRVLRFGMTRNLILGLEVVKMDGTIISSMKKITKDNSAYDIKQLFIGSEGTLGIITRAIIKLQELPKSRNSAFVGINDFNKVTQLLKLMDQGLAGSLSGFEVIWKDTYACLTGESSPWKPVLPHGYKYYVLIESLGSNQQKDHLILQSLLERAITNEIILDGVMANSESDLNWFWNIREDVSILNAACVIDQHFDISAPIGMIGSYVDDTYQKLMQQEGVTHAFAFGHLADGNIHFIVGKENSSLELTNKINDIIYTPLPSFNGSISAEHGIGLHKKRYLSLSRSVEEIQLMKHLKKLLDPQSLLNPGKVIDI